MERSAPTADVAVARRQFFDLGAEPQGAVSPTILNSWARCRARGFDSHGQPALEPVPSSTLKEHHDRSERLIRASRRELVALRGEARGAGAIAILTDGAGLVLDAAGDTGFAGKAARVALRPGVAWSEAASGTNAIGAALMERRPVEVRGGEHYFEPHRFLTCAAAPIFSPTGDLLGALDLSGPAGAPTAEALELIGRGVDQIERRLFEAAFRSEDVVRLQTDPDRFGGAQDGLLAFEGSRLVAANRHALRMLGLDWSALGQRSFRDLFEAPRSAFVDGVARSGPCGTLYARAARAPALTPGAAFESARTPAEARPASEPGPVFDAGTRADLARAVRLIEGDVPVLICGETGSGKEVFARAAHAASSRARKPFVAVNCAALPEGLIEAELFGYEEGAFTGARRSGSKGLLREADGGVLLLDEIGDMPLALQARLLRVVQERAVTPLGGGKPHPVDLRLLCATHRDLRAMTESGGFRADLYYRVAQYAVALPPLRAAPDRRAAALAFWATLRTEGRTLGPATLERMAAYDWPGNRRELVGAMKALIALSEPGDEIGPELLPAPLRGRASVPSAVPAPEGPAERTADLDTVARAAIASALDAAGGNVAEAARRLGVSRSTLYRRGVARRAS
ncbi:sigma-54-dependent Fis family transcriptional regulator [Methylopila jiangsuensis]|uniref:Sigma-54-dependent Fis family transcriptional regulator n=1 Tax=Methylopila jiangsuensis TaxID=586230 RepID=A0A9W6JJ28_9HYPH|nr:sigma-54-dependent Fis family transcriptional regulator [Methylopila jiangsuensis]MDR6285293.1 transcriptional regulator of acetoin/glycerol metabolism [Methylopila jiangsuensis]GLK77316.1 sigma-54-dependent Fis family transcriptional regulator [Methylopila jiangsuensis]